MNEFKQLAQVLEESLPNIIISALHEAAIGNFDSLISSLKEDDNYKIFFQYDDGDNKDIYDRVSNLLPMSDKLAWLYLKGKYLNINQSPKQSDNEGLKNLIDNSEYS